jgi:uncharacterized phage protein gp47/JayE
MTYDFLLGRMLGRITDDLDKREGSVIHDALAPCALELARFYGELERVIDETFADTAGREMLIRRAAERGISPFPATFAVVRAQFSAPVPLGTRFSLGDLRYRTVSPDTLICEAIGSSGNRSVGELVPVDYVQGLTSSRITALITPGENEEDTEHLRRRYFESLETQSYGGNISDYKKMTLAVAGVGGVKVEPAWNGGNTVRLVICDYQWLVPSAALVAAVQSSVDSLAPVGHDVTVAPVCGAVIDVTACFTLADGLTFAAVQPDLEQIAADYLAEIAALWAVSDSLIVRASHLESRLLNHDGVVDITDLCLNGGLNGRNITLTANQIPVRGGVTHAV